MYKVLSNVNESFSSFIAIKLDLCWTWQKKLDKLIVVRLYKVKPL